MGPFGNRTLVTPVGPAGLPTAKDVCSAPTDFSAPPGRYTKLFLVSPQEAVGEAFAGTSRKPDQLFARRPPKIAYLETSQKNSAPGKRYRGGWSLPPSPSFPEKNSYEELGEDRWHGSVSPCGTATPSISSATSRRCDENLFSNTDLSSKQTKKLTGLQGIRRQVGEPRARRHSSMRIGGRALRNTSCNLSQRQDKRNMTIAGARKTRSAAGIQNRWRIHRQTSTLPFGSIAHREAAEHLHYPAPTRAFEH